MARRRLGARLVDHLAPWGLTGLAAALVTAGLAIYLGPAPLDWGRPLGFAALALLLPLAVVQFHFGRRRAAAMAFSRVRDLAAAHSPLLARLAELPKALRLVALALVALALARPQRPSADLTEVEGIDIIITLDVSNSMSERDLRPNRLAAAQEVLRRFIERRSSDRIGLVIFGREAFTQCPLTLDYHALIGLLGEVRLDLIDGKGTAIGNALATALNRLRKSDAKSKIVILLTDGDNNAGNVAPQQAARLAQSLGVKIYTILMGHDVDAEAADPASRYLRPAMRYPVNPKLLEEIASLTGGTPYLATDTAALERRFQSILDELDRSRLRDVRGKPEELYPLFVAAALALLAVELLLALTRFRRFP